MKLLEPPVSTRPFASILLTLTLITVIDRTPSKFAENQARFSIKDEVVVSGLYEF